MLGSASDQELLARQAALQAGSGRSSCCGPVPSAPDVEGKFLSAFVRARKPTAARVLLSE